MQTLDETFMRQALSLAESALKAGDFPVGCVFVYDHRVVARGFRTGSADVAANEIDHAEINALREYYRLPAGHIPEKTTVYCTLEPCLMCFAALVIAGVGRIVYAYEDAMGGGTSCRLQHLPPLYRERRPLVTPHVLRKESLSLFQLFFKRPGATYLKGTYLADYTLQQSLESPPPPPEGR
jgi:tRNA(adenine34) deaminase